MNRDDIIRMAREADGQTADLTNWRMHIEELERFAAIVAAAGRSDLWVDLTKEECFEICTRYKNSPFSMLVAVQDALRAKNEPR